jgi:hypothetical protein
MGLVLLTGPPETGTARYRRCMYPQRVFRARVWRHVLGAQKDQRTDLRCVIYPPNVHDTSRGLLPTDPEGICETGPFTKTAIGPILRNKTSRTRGEYAEMDFQMARTRTTSHFRTTRYSQRRSRRIRKGRRVYRQETIHQHLRGQAPNGSIITMTDPPAKRTFRHRYTCVHASVNRL